MQLNAFGFLASPDVKADGVVNAGLLDQALVLAWVKLFICQFGGDPLRVTVSGESAGASSVMYHGLAVGGNLGTLLFDNAFAVSPYLPFQYDYDAEFPVSTYDALAKEVGCADEEDVLGCLRGADSVALQEASHAVTQTQPSGFWWVFWLPRPRKTAAG
ncbi:carboxylesterase family protein [Candidatus Bathyarchaeota archaeon]|nr:carboxylesterase family protein [Candidatus Bathyarchaeota archaeon]